jgi:hypothetical protein
MNWLGRQLSIAEFCLKQLILSRPACRGTPNLCDDPHERGDLGHSAVANVCRGRQSFRDDIRDRSAMLIGYARVV